MRKIEKPNFDELTDLELALFFARHIENPCQVLVGEKTFNIRNFYLKNAKQLLPNLKDAYARDFLKSIIKKYN